MATRAIPTPRNSSANWTEGLTGGNTPYTGGGYQAPAGSGLQTTGQGMNENTGATAPLGGPAGDWFSQNMPSTTQQPNQGQLSQLYGSGQGNQEMFQGGGAGAAPVGGYNQQFNAPTGVNFTNDPAYQFNAQELNRGVQNSQFSKGQGLTGGALKDLQKYQSGLAANTYQQVFNNQLAGQGFNRDTAFGNQDRALNSYTAQSNANAQSSGSALNAYLANRDTFWGDTDRLFGRNFSLASLGQNAASGYGNDLGQYGANGGNLYTNQGNANAAGTMGQANQFSNGVQNGIDIYSQYRGGR